MFWHIKQILWIKTEPTLYHCGWQLFKITCPALQFLLYDITCIYVTEHVIQYGDTKYESNYVVTVTCEGKADIMYSFCNNSSSTGMFKQPSAEHVSLL